MIKFKEKETGRVWTVSNAEHIKHFRSNSRFEELEAEPTKDRSKKGSTKKNK